MKKAIPSWSLTAFALLLFCSSPLFSQNREIAEKIAGSWLGTLSFKDQSLRLVLNIALNDKKETTVTLDSPDQGAKEIPGELTLLTADSIVVDIPSVSGKLTGKFGNRHEEISGSWHQGGIALPIVLKKTDQKVNLDRPQEPKPPFPYETRDITFENRTANLKLAGTLTLPTGVTNYPIVVLISGSGPQNRDEEIAGHKPFLVLADFLTRNGIGVLRYDDRGTGKSEGNFETATTLDFVSDASSAVDYLLKVFLKGKAGKGGQEQEVSVGAPGLVIQEQTERIGLVGHSEGGLIATIVASQRQDISTLVLIASPGLPGEKIIMTQSELIARESGYDESRIRKNLNVTTEVFDILKKYQDQTAASAKIKQILQKNYKNLPEGDPDRMTTEEIDQSVKTFVSPWFRFFLTYDPAQALTKVRCPVYALNGSNDFQVTAGENLQAIEKAMIFGGNDEYVTEEINGVNHLFQTTGTGLPAQYGKISETMSPDVMKRISSWILKH